MIDFYFPKWIKKLLVKFADNRQLTNEELADLRQRLKKFDVENPLVSIVIPAWNEEENITKTIASLAYNEFDFPCELYVINNNSTDNTQAVLDNIGVRSMMELNQGIAPARRRGLLEARGKYQLCCDSDTLYPPTWIKAMTEAIQNNEKNGVACIYGSYSFIPMEGKSRFVMGLYETGSSIIRALKSKKTEARRVMGFNFGLNKAVALEVNGFIMDKPRKFRNELGSAEYVGDSEDGKMASAIKKAGYKILYVNSRKSRAWTSDRRLQIDGGLMRAVMLRLLKIINRKAFDKIAKS
ncbi:MAG: glycosyltransferase family 2 protein [Prolixibacteraceae bacterium]